MLDMPISTSEPHRATRTTSVPTVMGTVSNSHVQKALPHIDASMPAPAPFTHRIAIGMAIVLGVPIGWIVGMIVAIVAGYIDIMLC